MDRKTKKLRNILLVILGFIFFPLGLIELGFVLGIKSERNRNSMEIESIIKSDAETEGNGIIEVSLPIG